MTPLEIARLMDAIADPYIEEAAVETVPARKHLAWKLPAIAAACLLLIAGSVFALWRAGLFRTGESSLSAQLRAKDLDATTVTEPRLVRTEALPTPQEYDEQLHTGSVVELTVRDPEYTVVRLADQYLYYLTAQAEIRQTLWGEAPEQTVTVSSAVYSDQAPEQGFVSDLSLNGSSSDCAWLVVLEPAEAMEIGGVTVPAEAAGDYRITQVVVPVPDCLELVGREQTFLYAYTGDKTNIDIPGLDFTLTLPDAWADRVDVYLQSAEEGPYFDRLVVSNRALAEEYALYFPSRDDNALPKTTDGVLQIHWVPVGTWDYSEDFEKGFCVDLGVHNGYQFVLFATEQGNPDADPDLMMRTMLIEKIGQEVYDALVGDLRCSSDEAKAMIRFPDAP